MKSTQVQDGQVVHLDRKVLAVCLEVVEVASGGQEGDQGVPGDQPDAPSTIAEAAKRADHTTVEVSLRL